MMMRLIFAILLTALHATAAMDCYVCRDCENNRAIIVAQEGCLKCQKSLKHGIVYKRCVTSGGESYLRELGINTNPGCRGVSHIEEVTDPLDVCFCNNSDMCNSAVEMKYFSTFHSILLLVSWMIIRVWLHQMI